MDCLEAGLEVTSECRVALLQKPTGCTEFKLIYNHSREFDTVLFILLSFFFFYRYVFLYTHCHLSSFASAKENVEKIWRKSILNLSHCSSLVPKLFEQKPNTSLLCILDSLFTSFFGQSKETKSHLRRQSNKWWSPPPHTMITQNILTLLMSMLLLCPFSITFFISGSLKKFIGSFPFFLLFSH